MAPSTSSHLNQTGRLIYRQSSAERRRGDGPNREIPNQMAFSTDDDDDDRSPLSCNPTKASCHNCLTGEESGRGITNALV